MSSFKDMVASDIHKHFLNPDEFGELRTVIYDGEIYQDIPVVLDEPEEKARRQMEDDHVQGLYLVTDILYCSVDDLGGNLPERDQKLKVNDQEGGGGFYRLYRVVTSTCKNGMLQVGLEAIDE